MAKRPVDAQVSFPKLEEQVLERWRERDVFAESLRRREGAEPWVFWEGPPTANGPPGVHHVLSRAFKDIFPRYRTMRGRYVERRGGWDCHGLPVEIAVEKQLGITRKEQIEQFGIAEFNAKCRESVFAFLEDWNALTERIGFWLDLDNAYRTLDATYIESVWWSLKQIADKGMLYEGHKVVPYCPRCGTALSSHEVALGYEDVIDPSVYVRFRVAQDGGPVQAGDELLVWTTTPWTLVSNAAVAVDPELVYVRAKTGALEAPVVLAEALIEKVLGDRAGVQILERFPGAALDGVRYEPPFPYLGADEYGERGHTVLLADFVTADDGTGLVHTAIAFGEDDFRLGAQYGLNVVNPVRLDGTYDERIGALRRALRQGRRRGPRRGPARARPAAARRALRALLPALLALRDAAAVLRQAVVVHRDLADPRRAARRQRADQLVPRAHQAGALRPLAGEQRRLGAVARALLGHAAARLALRAGPRHGRRLVRRARAALRRAPRGPAPPVLRRGDVRLRRVRRDRDARAGGDRRLVRLRRDAVRPAPRAVRRRAGARRDLPGRLHLRGARPDARLVLFAARRLDAAARPRGPLPQRRLPGPDPRCRGPEDVEVQGQRRRVRGRSSTASAPTRCAGTSSPPSSPGTATCSRPRRSARACGCSCASCGTRIASRRSTTRRA